MLNLEVLVHGDWCARIGIALIQLKTSFERTFALMGNTLTKKIKTALINWLNKPFEKREFPICDFERVRHEIRPCDVLLIEGQNRVSEIIKLVTQSAWSHSALYIGRLHDIENPILRERVRGFLKCSEEEQLLIEGMLGQGTIVSSLSNYKLEHIRICRPKGISHQDAQKVIGYAVGHLGTEYNMRASFDLFRLMYPWGIIPRHWRSTLFQSAAEDDPNREICSTLIAEAFRSVKFPILPTIKRHKHKGIEFVPRNPKLYTPRDFDYSPYFEIIKYPLFEIGTGAIYKNLPWSEEGIVSDDKGELYSLDPENKKDG